MGVKSSRDLEVVGMGNINSIIHFFCREPNKYLDEVIRQDRTHLELIEVTIDKRVWRLRIRVEVQLVVESSLTFLYFWIGGGNWTFFLAVVLARVSQFLVFRFRLSPVFFFVLWLSHYSFCIIVLSSLCCVHLPFHIISLCCCSHLCIFFFKLLEKTLFQVKGLSGNTYLCLLGRGKVWVHSTLPNPTCGITQVWVHSTLPKPHLWNYTGPGRL